MIEQLQSIIKQAVVKLWPALNQLAVVVDQPDQAFGDLSTNVAFVIAKMVGDQPAKVAEKLADELKKSSIDFVDVVPRQGFINFRLQDEVYDRQLREIINQANNYGSSDIGRGKKARVEFISANPTGPLHIGNARGGPLGDVISSVLEGVGYQVLREYFHNDTGNQVQQLGQSIVDLQRGQPLADQPYPGEYVRELAQKIGSVIDVNQAGQRAVSLMLQSIMQTAADMGITFDMVTSEHELVQSGGTPAVLELLREKKTLKDRDGAVWFAPNDDFLKDRECVVIKSDHQLTYFANDIAYHNRKFSTGYDLVVDVFGPDHHGHIQRLKAAIKVLGHDASKLRAVTYQWVRVKRAGQVIEMSKRTGQFIAASEVLDEVGRDAFRFFMLMHDSDTHLDFDIELARKRSQDNPVYYVQYAAVRAAHIIQNAIRQPADKNQNEDSKVKIFEPIERKLIVHLSNLPSLVEEISQTFKVHQLTRYAIDTARLFHDFYEQRPVIDRGVVSRHRFNVVKATLVVLDNTLNLLGVSLPERM